MDTASLDRLNAGGLLLFGCGRMGSALLKGWLAGGIEPSAVTVMDPRPSDWLLSLEGRGVKVNVAADKAAACVLAVKPQLIASAKTLGDLAPSGTVFISIAAGTTIDVLGQHLGTQAKIVRAMPNTPAAIAKGVTAFIGNNSCAPIDLAMAASLLETVGETVQLSNESQMDAVTGVSGSGPAYVFHMIECLTVAGVAQGLSEDVATQLATQTVFGAGALAAAQADVETASQLRENVTSPAGTTAAGLEVLMAEQNGLMPLVKQTVAAATARSRELGKPA